MLLLIRQFAHSIVKYNEFHLTTALVVSRWEGKKLVHRAATLSRFLRFFTAPHGTGQSFRDPKRASMKTDPPFLEPESWVSAHDPSHGPIDSSTGVVAKSEPVDAGPMRPRPKDRVGLDSGRHEFSGLFPVVNVWAKRVR